MEFGGYLPLELAWSKEYYNNTKGYSVGRYNSGRSGIIASLNNCDVNQVYIPYYNCHVVEESLTKYGYKTVKYKIGQNFFPLLDEIKRGDWLIYIDYFGICDEQKKRQVVEKYKNVIFDNTQAFFAPPIIENNVFNVYSCRKFFGVSDGAYVICGNNNVISDNYVMDNSWERSLYLIKSYEKGTNGAYLDSLESEKSIGYDIKLMSPFTRMMMRSINYKNVKEARVQNYNYLVDALSSVNELVLHKSDEFVPMVYPLLIKNDNLRESMIRDNVYIPQWWKYLIGSLDNNDYEVYLSKYLLPLPIDQRYSIKDMQELVRLILQKININV